jgi:MFS family permease
MGWDSLYADGTLSAFHISSMIFVLPIALWSDRLGSRKRLLLTAACMVVLGVGLLSFASGTWIWLGVMLAGFVRDAFMAIFTTMVVETENVGPVYAGTAIGLTMAISGIGNIIAPPLGNSLAAFWPGAPFAFWAFLGVLGMICLFFVKTQRVRTDNIVLENSLEHI